MNEKYLTEDGQLDQSQIDSIKNWNPTGEILGYTTSIAASGIGGASLAAGQYKASAGFITLGYIAGSVAENHHKHRVSNFVEEIVEKL